MSFPFCRAFFRPPRFLDSVLAFSTAMIVSRWATCRGVYMQAIETVLLTGASGFVGRQLLWRFARLPHVRVKCLLRAQDNVDRRLQEILEEAQPTPLTAEERSRCSAVAGDLTSERLGLGSEQWTALSG